MTFKTLTTTLLLSTSFLLFTACDSKITQEEANVTTVQNPITTETTVDTSVDTDTSTDDDDTVTGTETIGGGDSTDTTPQTQADTTPPNITLNGKSNITLTLGDVYEELGATATDAVDGTVSVSISGSVDTSTVGTYTMTYSATDKAGNEASVSREVVVGVGYKIIIGKVEGNTAQYEDEVEFRISLSHQPTHDVVIHVESDNKNEGVVMEDAYTYAERFAKRDVLLTPTNWKRGKIVVVQGTNKNVINGKQDYHIVTSPTVSDDPHFNGIDPEDVHMVGKILKIGIPNKPQVFFSGIEKSLFVWLDENSNYELHNRPKITLVDKPDGIVTDEYGMFAWKPTKNDEGKTFHIKAKVRDGNFTILRLSDEVSFDVRVAKEKVLKTIVKENEVTIVDESSSLKGVSLVFDSKQNIADKIRVMKIDAVDVPKGGYFTHISDTFRIQGAEGHFQTIKIKMPISSLPKDIDLNTIELYTWESTDGTNFKLEKNGVIPDDMWYGMYPDKIYRDLLDWDNIIFEFNYIYTGRLIVIGGEKKKSQVIKTANYKSYQKQNEVPCYTTGIRCIPEEGFWFWEDNNYSNQVCTTTKDKDIAITVLNFGDKPTSRRWDNNKSETGACIDDLVQWLLDAQDEFRNTNLSKFDKKFTVLIRDLGEYGLGQVKGSENRKVLHLTSRSKPIKLMQSTAVHEYFHHETTVQPQPSHFPL